MAELGYTTAPVHIAGADYDVRAYLNIYDTKNHPPQDGSPGAPTPRDG